MQELIKIVTEKTGVSPEIATKVVNVVAGYMKTKMPAVGSQIDSLISGGSGTQDTASKIAGGVSDMFGKK